MGAGRGWGGVLHAPCLQPPRFKKLGFDSVNVYARASGESEWHFLARDTNSPYDDHRELAKPGTPEVREYRLIGVLKDQESGTPSDSTSVTFSG
jgi:hypothetical protein